MPTKLVSETNSSVIKPVGSIVTKDDYVASASIKVTSPHAKVGVSCTKVVIESRSMMVIDSSPMICSYV